MTYYRLISGKHVSDGPEGCECERCVDDRKERQLIKSKRNHVPRMLGHIYRAGDIIETDQDLKALFDHPNSIRFELVDSAGRPESKEKRRVLKSPVVDEISVGDGLDDMTVADLRRFADEEEIDLGEVVKKADILKVIRTANVESAAVSGFAS